MPPTRRPAQPDEPEPEPARAAAHVDDDLFDRARARAPHLTREFVDEHRLTVADVEAIAAGDQPPPPYIGPDTSAVDLHRTPGGWQLTPKGVSPAEVGRQAIAR